MGCFANLHFSPLRPQRAQRFMYYNDLYKIAELIIINRMLPLVKAGFGHNFFNMNQLCVLGVLCGEISGLINFRLPLPAILVAC
jgi:hypothetical protein